MKIIDFIKDNAKFHSFMTYNNSMKSFDIEPYKETHPGVYFIVCDDCIQKVGKAEGKYGLKGRMSQYTGNKVKTFQNDKTDVLWNSVMTNELKNKKLEMYVLPTEPIIFKFLGIEVEGMIARSLEKKLSILAREQDHPMLLSRGN
jgi:hypothetical protein